MFYILWEEKIVVKKCVCGKMCPCVVSTIHTHTHTEYIVYWRIASHMDAVRIRVASPITVFSYDICSDLKMMLIMIDMVHIWNNEGVHDGQYCINRNIDDDDDAEMSQPEEEDNNKQESSNTHFRCYHQH